jgi:hypothetical protein
MPDDSQRQPPDDLPYAKSYSIPYAGYHGGHRPGILTTVAIFDIILASLGFFCGLGVMLTRVAAPPPPAPVAIAPSITSKPLPAGEYVAPDGFSAAQRQVVIDALVRAHPISAARRGQLDAILADDGKQIIRLSPDYLTADRLSSYITEVRSNPDPDRGPLIDVFVLGSGSLSLKDQSAVFAPDGQNASIIVRDGVCSEGTRTRLDALQIGAVVAQVQKLCNNAMTVAQMYGLATALRVSGQSLIVPSSPAAAQVRSALVQPDGSIQISTAGGEFHASADGMNFGTYSYNYSSPTTFGTPSQLSKGDIIFRIVDWLIAILNVAVLLILGILLLRNWPRSRQAHLIYAVVKLAAMFLMAWFAYEVDVGWETFLLALAVIYPIVLLIVMNGASVREYYEKPAFGRVL